MLVLSEMLMSASSSIIDAGPVSAVGSVSHLAFGSSQDRFLGQAQVSLIVIYW